jgi:hypothetical protein
VGRTMRLERTNASRLSTNCLVPTQGEDIGRVLEQLGDQMFIQQKLTPTYMLDRVATIYELSADAYQLGADVTIGHNRSDRYNEYSKNALRKATEARKLLEQRT